MRGVFLGDSANGGRIGLSCLAFGALLFLHGCADTPGGRHGAANPAAPLVCERPPTLSEPLTFVDACPGDAGFPEEISAKGRDVLIRLPSDRVCYQPLHVMKGGNVWIRGGAFLMTDAKASAVISVSRSSGTTFIEGLSIDVAGKPADAIRVFRHTGRLVVQNTFARRISGRIGGVHGDLVHAQGDGPLEELVLQTVSGYTGYQGLFAPYRARSGHGTRKLVLDRVNIAYDPTLDQSAGAGKPLMLLFIGDAENPDDLPPERGASLKDVYVDASLWGRPFERSVYPRPHAAFGRCADFDREHGITGEVCDGMPPGGDFAPVHAVGTSYERARFCGDEEDEATTPGRDTPEAISGAPTPLGGSGGGSAVDLTRDGARR